MTKKELVTATAKWYRWAEKQGAKKPPPVRLLMSRTIGTASHIVESLGNIDFSSLSSNLYFLCQDFQTKQFTREYDAQMELAAINPEAFAKGLHKFYMRMARQIQKENLYPQFIQFLATCAQFRYEKEHGSIAELVVETY